MYSPTIRYDELDPEAWRNCFRLLAPPPAQAGTHGPGGSRGSRAPLILFVEGGRCVKALQPGRGRLDPAEFPWRGPSSLGPHRRQVGARIALAFEDDVIDQIADAIDRRVRAREDYVAQILGAGEAVRERIGRGVHVDPDVLGLLPVPSPSAAQRTFDLLLPDDRSAGLFVFERGRIYASMVLVKRGGDAVRVTTHAALGVRDPELRRSRDLVAAMEARVGKPHAALFCTLDAWREIVGPEPGALARQIATRQAVLDPMPPWLLALTGAGAAFGVAQEASRLFGRFIPQAVKDTARAMSPFAALGFDPIELFTRIRKSV